MPVRKKPSGRFEATLKDGRTFIAAKTFDRQGDALAWLARERAAIAGDLDVRAGQTRVRAVLPVWVEGRIRRVAAKTAQTDSELLRLLSPALGALAISNVGPRHLDAWYQWLLAKGLGQSSVVRYRASMSSFLSWAVTQHYLSSNPALLSKAPMPTEEPDEMRPFSEDELAEVVASCRVEHPHFGDIVEVAGWTGLRWGELRALRVSDVQRVPMLGLHVTKSQTEGGKVKPTKAYATRLVPLAQQIWPTVQRLMQGKSPNDFLVTGPSGGQLWTGTFRRAVKWNDNGRGRRPHDLRHTAACLWLARGVDVGTVQKWCGHRSVATTNIYLHWLGTAADKSALALLDAPRQAPGTGAEVAVLPVQAGQ